MRTKKPTPPLWIVARLGEDLNWWLDKASSDTYAENAERGLLDPRQIAYLVELLEEYRPYGYRHELLNAAFQVFQAAAELDEDRLRLVPVDADIGETGDQLFALPLAGEGGTGVYYEFLDAITSAHIRKLNATHRYARACTDLEMQEELDALDRDRYFALENIHTFDEINEILQWNPAEWDDSSSV
jgi:hypothetical protein